MDPILKDLVEAVSESEDLETFVRPLLKILESVTGLESTYLTSIDLDQNTQTVLFARNSRNMEIPEGITVPWGDSLCKRAIHDDCFYSDDVSGRWGDSQAAWKLGIETFLSHPVRLGSGELHGTLCGVSSGQVRISQDAHQLLIMFSDLIARQLDRERLLARLRQENITYQQSALTDPLTGIPNRRAALAELSRTLQVAQRSQGVVHAAFIDLDGFKTINDTYGHDAGDRFLIEMANSLTAGLRQADFVSRYGGDEFLAFGMDFSADPDAGRDVFRHRMEALTSGRFSIGDTSLDCPGASVGAVTSEPGDDNTVALIARADEAMYAIKRKRRAIFIKPAESHPGIS